MHKRSLLIGLGIGIIIGALLLQLFNLGSDSQKQLDQLSNEINGMTLDGVSPTPGQTTPNKVIDDNVTEVEELTPPPSHTTDEEASPVTDVEAQQAPTDPPAGGVEVVLEQSDKTREPIAEGAEAAIQYILRVHPGATVNKIAQLLVDHNIIESAVSFAAHLKEQDTRIRAGYFLVEENNTDEQVRKLLSGEPLSEKERKTYINVEKLTLIE